MSKKLKLTEALRILKDLGMPRAQQNERTALCLLALVNVTPTKRWAGSEAPLVGITPIMDWAKEYYGTGYAPNTRETFRRQSMHQFIEAGQRRIGDADRHRERQQDEQCADDSDLEQDCDERAQAAGSLGKTVFRGGHGPAFRRQAGPLQPGCVR